VAGTSRFSSSRDLLREALERTTVAPKSFVAG
jgi:hypothetical protein